MTAVALRRHSAGWRDNGRNGARRSRSPIVDAAGEYPIRIELVRLEDDQTIGEDNSVTAIPDRRTAHEMIYDLTGIVLELPGRYDFRVFANGRFVGGEILLVESVE